MSKASAAAPSGSDPSGDGSDSRLMELYWNRAQLKKEYAALRRERFQLLDALTEQEGRTARYRQKLEYLEDLLGDAETADNTVAFFTLSRLWRRCAARLVTLAADLREQRKIKELEALRDAWRQDLKSELSEFDKKLREAKAHYDSLRAELQALDKSLESASGIGGAIRRRRLREERDAAGAAAAAAQNELASLVKARSQLATRQPEPPADLSIRSRRAINLTVVALAERMAQHFGAHEISDLARQTLTKSAGSLRFGPPDVCRAIVRQAHELTHAFEQLERQPGFIKSLTERARALHSEVTFSTELDTIPEPRSVVSADINVLERDVWNVNQALIV